MDALTNAEWRQKGFHPVLNERAIPSMTAVAVNGKLHRQDLATVSGGKVIAIIGNHEAMNVQGDLRYVHPGEYAAFATRNSPRVRDQFYQRYIDQVEAEFKVTVLDVRIVSVRSKQKRRGRRTMGTVPGWKKAIVQLREGDTIEIFEGAQV